MGKGMIKQLEDKSAYSNQFFSNLFDLIDLKEEGIRETLRRRVLDAEQTYLRHYNHFEGKISPHQIRKELDKTVKHIEKAKSSLEKLIVSESYDRELANGICWTIDSDYSDLKDYRKALQSDEDNFNWKVNPEKILDLLSIVNEGIENSLKYNPLRKVTRKNKALERWLVALSGKLEPVMGRRLEQAHYYKTDNGGAYISNKVMNDSELLLFMIKPCDPSVTISQIETAIKNTHKERIELKNI